LIRFEDGERFAANSFGNLGSKKDIEEEQKSWTPVEGDRKKKEEKNENWKICKNLIFFCFG
jgi:hypothetical protein